MRLSRPLLISCAAVIAIFAGAQGLTRWHGAPLGYGHSWYGACGHDSRSGLASALPHLEELLAISPVQRNAWDAFAAALGDAEQNWREACYAATTPSTVPELFAHLVRVMDTALRGLHEIEPSLAELYAALTDTQRQRLDALFADRVWR